ncbi:MAG: hypothetical protein ABJE10_05070 [bacterium]
MAVKLAPESPASRLSWLGAAKPGRDVFRFGISIFVGATFSAVQVFVIPRRLDLATYGQYRLFLVYVTYIELLNFGLVDGAFLRWAGRRPDTIAFEWRVIARWLLGIQALLIGIALLARALVHDSTIQLYLIAFAVCATFVNVSVLSSYALQASGDFKRAGRIFFLAPALFVLTIALTSFHSLTAMLLAYVGAFAVAAGYAAFSVMRVGHTITREAHLPSDLSRSTLIRSGAPVLGANVAAVLARSADRVLVSIVAPITSFALYGFASTVMVAASVATQALSRVALAHAARRPLSDRAMFLGGFLDAIATAYGIGLVAEPFFEYLVARFLPAYVSALPIVRALTVGLPLSVAIQVVLVGTLQSYGLVRRQLLVGLCGFALVVIFCGTALSLHAPLWIVAASASAAAAVMIAVGDVIVRRVVVEARGQTSLQFIAVIAAQSVALGAALALSDNWMVRSVTYGALAVLPTWLMYQRVQKHGW